VVVIDVGAVVKGGWRSSHLVLGEWLIESIFHRHEHDDNEKEGHESVLPS